MFTVHGISHFVGGPMRGAFDKRRLSVLVTLCPLNNVLRITASGKEIERRVIGPEMARWLIDREDRLGVDWAGRSDWEDTLA